MEELNEQPTQYGPAINTVKLAWGLAKLREARSNLTNQDLIAKRIEERKRIIQTQIDQARQKVSKLEVVLGDEVAHRETVERVLREELRLAELFFKIPLFVGTLIGPRTKPEK